MSFPWAARLSSPAGIESLWLFDAPHFFAIYIEIVTLSYAAEGSRII
jgi:hypothetical protein